MIALAVVVAAPLFLWLFSLAAVRVIEWRWPPLGRAAEVGGVRLRVLQEGPADAPTLVLVHGASGNLREPLAALAPALSGRFRLVAVDRPGNGHSGIGPRAMSDPSRQADMVAAALAALGIGPALFLGHSWGAALVAALAIRHPSRVEGLVLLAPASHPWPGGAISRRTRFFAHSPLGPALAALVVVPLGLLLARPTIRAIFAPAPAAPGYGKAIGALLAIRPAAFVAGCREVADFYGHVLKLSARYDAIRAPTEIVASDVDRVVATAIHACGLARDIPGARLTILPGAGHMPHWTRTEDVVEAIERAAARARQARRPAR